MFGGRLGWSELLVILLIALLIFGPAKLPQMGKAIGESMREFKKSVKGLNEEADDQKDESKKA